MVQTAQNRVVKQAQPLWGRGDGKMKNVYILPRFFFSRTTFYFSLFLIFFIMFFSFFISLFSLFLFLHFPSIYLYMLNFKVKFPTILRGYDLRDVEEWEQQSLPRVDFVVWFAMVLTDV